MPNRQALFTTVDSGQLISSPFSLRNASIAGVWAPTVNSCQCFFRVSFDATSSNYVRISETGSAQSPQLTWNIGPGSKALILSSLLAAFPEVKLELSVAQTDVRTFVIMGRF